MDVSNTTTTDTQYRTASGNPRLLDMPKWIKVPAGKTVTVPDPPCPFRIEFQVGGKVVSTQNCAQPVRRISLVLAGAGFQTRRYMPPSAPRPRQAATRA